jgi:hypothetical protein
MRKYYVAAALAAIMTAVTPTVPAFAQAAGGATATTAITIAPADATTLRTWITGQKTASVAAPAGFNIAVGSVVPAAIMLRPITVTPAIASVGTNQYAIIGDRIVLVNPMTRAIVYVFPAS